MEHQLKQISDYGELEIGQNELKTYEVLGTGSFGIVKKARWRGTPIAIKQLNESVLDSHGIEEFVHDLYSLSKFHHPNIVQLVGACTTQKPFTICMELMPYSLEDKIYDLHLIEKKNIAIDIARGLAYLHNRKPQFAIHRDLKPSNILLTPSLKAKLTDFGISMFHLDKYSNYSMTGETGTYRYMAPEVLRHETYNYKVDIWSFGMVLYHMFEGKIPYIHYEFKEMIMRIADNKLPRFETCPKNMEQLIRNCLTTPEYRLEALQLIETLEQLKLVYTLPKPKPPTKQYFCCIKFY